MVNVKRLNIPLILDIIPVEVEEVAPPLPIDCIVEGRNIDNILLQEEILLSFNDIRLLCKLVNNLQILFLSFYMNGNTKNTRKHKLIQKSKYTTKKNKTKRIYSDQDYNSGDGMLTTVWGPSMWHFLHTMSFNYPVHPSSEDKKHYRDFIYSLRHILPCKYCRINLKNNLDKVPITAKDLKNRESFSRYIYNLHETVNKMLKKNSHLSYNQVRERYEHFRSRCTEEKPQVFRFLTKERRSLNLKTRKNRGKKEKGCTEPLYGKKSKCIIKIVPQEEKGSTFQMDKKCVKSRGTEVPPTTPSSLFHS